MTAADPRALLDALDEAHAKATPGEWSNPRPFTKLIDAPGSTDNLAIVQCDNAADAALIVAEHNALPALTAAVRAALELHVPIHGYCVVCDAGRDTEALGNNPDCTHRYSYCRQCDSRWPCRTVAEVTAALTGGQA